jgi:hypothetical protein
VRGMRELHAVELHEQASDALIDHDSD